MKHEIKFIGKNEDDKWPHFAWSVTINGERFDYRTGLGHSVKGGAFWKAKKDGKSLRAAGTERGESVYATVPQIDDILECLFFDAQAGEMSFDDFCGDFGYSTDSISAFNTYRACSESGQKLRRALGKEYHQEQERIEKRNEATA